MILVVPSAVAELTNSYQNGPSSSGRGALNFQFGIGVWPKGLNRGAYEETTANFLDPGELNFV